MLCEQRPSSQFKGVFSNKVSWLWGETILNCAQTTQKHNNALCHQGSRLQPLRKKGCISGNADKASSTLRRALLLHVKVNTIFVILWTSQHERIWQVCVARGNEVGPAHTSPSNPWRAYSLLRMQYTKFSYYHSPYLNDVPVVPEEEWAVVAYRAPDIFTAAFFHQQFPLWCVVLRVQKKTWGNCRMQHDNYIFPRWDYYINGSVSFISIDCKSSGECHEATLMKLRFLYLAVELSLRKKSGNTLCSCGLWLSSPGQVTLLQGGEALDVGDLHANVEGHTGLQPDINSTHSRFFKEANFGTAYHRRWRKLTEQLHSFTTNNKENKK